MIPKLVGRSPGRWMLIARSPSGDRGSATGSLTRSAPAAIVAVPAAPKVSWAVGAGDDLGAGVAQSDPPTASGGCRRRRTGAPHGVAAEADADVHAPACGC